MDRNILMSMSRLLLVALLTVGGADAVDIETTIECHVRQYEYNISRPHTLENGTKLPCHGMVIVDSCWGRCDSNEIPDYKPPYKQSNHPVCTYSGRRSRFERLLNCHPSHPHPYAEVFDAIHCVCRQCSSHDTSCEGLNG